jgi:transposase
LGGHARDHGQPGHHVARLGAAGLTAQKKSLIAAERDAAARQQWREGLAASAPQRFVFLDETATPTSLTRLRARAPRGERALGTVPRRRWQSVSLLASMTTTGMGPAMVLDGAINREAFDAFVEQCLLPALVPGQIVLLDNLAVHKSPRARAMIEGVGCQVRFLPSDSPDFNPIELAFSKIKQHLRGAAERTFAGLVAATGPALEAVTAADARGFFAHCGYPLSGQLL